MNRKEFEGIALDVAYHFEMDLDEIMDRYCEGDVRIFDNRYELIQWLYMDDYIDMRSFIENVMTLSVEDLQGFEDIAHYYLDDDDRVFLADDGRCVFLYE